MHTNNTIYIANKPSFGSIKQEKIIAEKLLKKCRNTIKDARSNTFIKTKIYQHENDKKYQKIIEELIVLSEIYRQLVVESRQFIKVNSPYKTFDDMVQKIKTAIQKFRAGNCGEINYIFQSEFLKHNINAHAVMFTTYSQETLKKIPSKDHTFLVFNLKPDAKLNAPATWGSRAIIADAWSNIVMKADDALNYYKQIFKFNEKEEIRILASADKINLKDGIR